MVSKTHCTDYPRPAVTADVVFVRLDGSQACVLLIRRRRPPFAGSWALPGGFVDENETLEHAAARELLEETGLSQVSLVQLKTFSHPDRDPRTRVITTAFLALTPVAPPPLRAGDDAAQADWHKLSNPPPLAFDHGQILRSAIARMREMLVSGTIGYFLAGRWFSAADLTRISAAILGCSVDDEALQRRIISSPFIASQTRTGMSALYQFVFPPPVTKTDGIGLRLP